MYKPNSGICKDCAKGVEDARIRLGIFAPTYEPSRCDVMPVPCAAAAMSASRSSLQ